MVFSRILVAYDGSELGEKALAFAVQLANLNKEADLHIVHTVTVPHIFTVKEYIHADQISEEIMKHGKQILDVAKQKLSLLAAERYKDVILEGKPADEILNYAREQKCDLIIMGSRGLNNMQELFLGSVSHEVAQRSAVPVIIVK